MSLRAFIGIIGATALAFLLTIGSATGVVQQALAQTDETEAEDSTFESRRAEAEAERAAAYQSFIADIADELGGLDSVTVDAAIRSSLQQAVDDREAAGDLSIERAAALRAVIGVTDTPLMLGMTGPIERQGGIRERIDGRRGERGSQRPAMLPDKSIITDDGDDATEGTPEVDETPVL